MNDQSQFEVDENDLKYFQIEALTTSKIPRWFANFSGDYVAHLSANKNTVITAIYRACIQEYKSESISMETKRKQVRTYYRASLRVMKNNAPWQEIFADPWGLRFETDYSTLDSAKTAVRKKIRSHDKKVRLRWQHCVMRTQSEYLSGQLLSDNFDYLPKLEVVKKIEDGIYLCINLSTKQETMIKDIDRWYAFTEI